MCHILKPNQNIQRCFIVISLAIILASCAVYGPENTVRNETIDTVRLSEIKKIVLLDVPIPSKIYLGDPASDAGGFFFGIAGSMAAASHEGDTVVDGRKLALNIQQDAKRWLEEAGITVQTRQARRLNPSKMLQSYAQFSEEDVDAILEIGPTHIGFREQIGKVQFSEGELSPDVGLVYRLVEVKTGEVIVESSVLYSSFDYPPKSSWGKNILGPRQHLFQDVESVKNNRHDAARKLDFAINGATEYIVMIIANDNKRLQYSNVDALSLQATDDFDITGLYSSKVGIVTKPMTYAPWTFIFNRKTTHQIRIEQRGNTFVGKFVEGANGEITGTFEDDKLKFLWVTFGGCEKGEGEWNINSKGSALQGNWKCGDADGTWVMHKIF